MTVALLLGLAAWPAAAGPLAAPVVRITSPAAGAKVEPAPVEVRGFVDLEGMGHNARPRATLDASPQRAAAPVEVTFTLGATDDGPIASWSLDFGDGSSDRGDGAPPRDLRHTYTTKGEYHAKLLVKDQRGATGRAQVALHLQGMPEPDARVHGTLVPTRQSTSPGSPASATGTKYSSAEPTYQPGERLVFMSRATRSELDPLEGSIALSFFVFNAVGQQVAGPLAATAAPEEAVFACGTNCLAYASLSFKLPSEWTGSYWLAARARTSLNTYWLTDDLTGFHVRFHVGSSPQGASAPGPQGSPDDPEVTDPQDSSVPFLDIRKAWITGETATSFQVVVQVQDLDPAPPGLNLGTPLGTVRAAVNYLAEFCLDNNVNHESPVQDFCYRLGALHSTPTPEFTASVITADNSGSCLLSGAVLGGAFDTASDTITWTLSRAAFNVTRSGFNVAECTTPGISRDGNPILDGTTLRNLAIGSGLSAGARILLNINVGDVTDPGTARPYVFGGGATSAKVEVYLDNETTPRGSANVAVSDAEPSALWTVTVDFTGLTGNHDLKARWVGSDGQEVATHRITIRVQATGAMGAEGWLLETVRVLG